MVANETSPWSFRSGNLALDFANTVDWHASQNPEELLISYAALVNWSREFGVFQDAHVESLHEKASQEPEDAVKALSQALVLRDAIYQVFHAVAQKFTPSKDDLEIIKQYQIRGLSAASLEPRDMRFGWNWEIEHPNFEQMLWPVAQAAVDLLLSKNLSQVGQCADDRGCGMLFIDTSRNHSRQWCSMESCGNRAKAQRHYHRHKKSGGGL